MTVLSVLDSAGEASFAGDDAGLSRRAPTA
jgi:hypothetical protein